jgi:phosphoglycerate dehydrogenase-like enzyme
VNGPPAGRPIVVCVVCAGPADEPPGLAARLGEDAIIRPVSGTAELAAVLPDSDVAFAWDFASTRLREAWTSASRVRWVHTASAGVDRLLFPGLRDRRVIVTNSRGVFDEAIAEFVLGAVLAVAKDLPRTLRLQREHVWEHRETRLVSGSAALVIGAGSVGRAVARLLRAVGCHVTGVTRSSRDAAGFHRVVQLPQLGRELAGADVIVVTAPLTPETVGLLGTSAFARTKPGALLINVGRGAIVDEAALLQALDEGRLGAAVLDVFGHEPLPPGHPFWDRPDVVVSPHMCGDFQGFTEVLVDVFADNFSRWRAGKPLRNVVDMSRGY